MHSILHLHKKEKRIHIFYIYMHLCGYEYAFLACKQRSLEGGTRNWCIGCRQEGTGRPRHGVEERLTTFTLRCPLDIWIMCVTHLKSIQTIKKAALLAYGLPFQLSSVGLESWLWPLSEAFLSMLLKDWRSRSTSCKLTREKYNARFSSSTVWPRAEQCLL